MTDTNDVIKPNPEKNIKLKLTQRQVNIALNELILDRYNVDLPNDLEYLNTACNSLELTESYRESLVSFSKSNVLPDESIAWLQDDLRAALWFDHYSYYYNKDSFQWKNYSADFQSNLITCFDLTNIRLPHRDKAKLFDYKVEWKRDFINKAKGIYNNIRTMPQDLEWLDSKNEKQILWAHSYLGTHGYLIQNPLFLCNDLSTYYVQICASLDALDTLNHRNSRSYKMSLFKKDVLNKMRNAWSQKKFRDKKDAETAQEYFLTRRHMNKLKKLADEYGLSSKEYLQQMIDKEYNSLN
ncbi:hypothetical protein [Psychrobacter sp. Rd 27.2]|uniref:hypothetical protein n=1 Tax=Psychrobacter sp. Rd 27.2 TaxID=1926479 RepID=UPI000946AA8D|nr:hypothetical protein [Psychrobacter sp. Rd 27.2]OLF40772.1 hypothetical protein BTV99_07025 [Psychrobacter sp. Rd 27.2]